MTRLDVLEMIGDVIASIDLARGSLLPNDPNRGQLDDSRFSLDDLQRRLSQAMFDEGSQQFQDAAEKLKAINGEIRAAIQHAETIVAALDNIRKFLDAATTLVTATALIAGLPGNPYENDQG